MNQPLLSVNNLTHLYAPGKGFSDVSFDLWPGEVLGIVGESGSGKTTLLKSISARLTPQQGEIHYENRSLYAMSEADRRRLLRTEWGVVHQHPLDGLRRQVSAGGNIGERLMATGARHYGDIRATAQKWLEEVEIPANRIDDLPTTFSGGMQQRLQIARNLVTHPKLVFMDEPTGGLDVSVQARLLDLLRGLVVELNLAVVIVTHDLGVASLLDAAFRVADDQSNRFTLPQAVKLVTKNPAQALNLQDRGVIGEGKRADLVLAHRKDNHIHIDHVWRQGKRVF